MLSFTFGIIKTGFSRFKCKIIIKLNVLLWCCSNSNCPGGRGQFALLKYFVNYGVPDLQKVNKCERQDNPGKTEKKIMKGHCLR